ncbi:MAG: N-acetyltransferase [Cyclobacteriaceae bacterium]
MEIRLANINDLPAIVEIYNQAIRAGFTTGDTEEFSVDQRAEWFQKFDADIYPIYAALLEGKVVGYAYLSPYRPGRQAMSKIAEISYFVDYSNHRKGIAGALIQHILSDCERLKKETLLAILLGTNTTSIHLLEKFGFQKWGHLPDVIDFNGSKCDHLIYGLKFVGQVH